MVRNGAFDTLGYRNAPPVRRELGEQNDVHRPALCPLGNALDETWPVREDPFEGLELEGLLQRGAAFLADLAAEHDDSKIPRTVAVGPIGQQLLGSVVPPSP